MIQLGMSATHSAKCNELDVVLSCSNSKCIVATVAEDQNDQNHYAFLLLSARASRLINCVSRKHGLLCRRTLVRNLGLAQSRTSRNLAEIHSSHTLSYLSPCSPYLVGYLVPSTTTANIITNGAMDGSILDGSSICGTTKTTGVPIKSQVKGV